MPARPILAVSGPRTTGYVVTVQADGTLAFAAAGGGGGGVTSFQTRTGAVTLTKADVTGTGLTYSDVGAASSSDSRLTDTRTPTDGSVTAAKVAASLKPSGSAAASDEALRALGTTATTAAAGNDSRLSDQRTPTDGSVTAAKVSATLKPSGSAATSDEALRALGTTAGTACAGNDSRLSDSRTPTGTAGGELAGTFPNPGIGANLKQAKRRKLAYAAQGITGDAVGDASLYATGTSPGTQVEVGRLLGACDQDVITYVIVKFISVAGLSLTNAYVAVYDGVVSSATQLGVSADIKASITTGLVRFALATPITKSGDGAIYCTVKQEGATLATVARSGAAVGENGVGSGVASSVSRSGVSGAPATGATFSTNANGWFMAWA